MEALIDDDGLTAKFEAVLRKIFLKYASPSPSVGPSDGTSKSKEEVDVFSNEYTMSRADLEQFTRDTNGQELTDETFNEMVEFFDILEPVDEEEEQEDGKEDESKPASTDKGKGKDKDKEGDGPRLTFKGLIQLYTLQTDNDPDETWSDLTAWGYDTKLALVRSRKEAEGQDSSSEVERPSKDELTGLGLGGEKKQKA